jgi:hypothetical protein
MRETCFPGVELRVGRMEIGEGVRIGESTVIVADDLVLGAGDELVDAVGQRDEVALAHAAALAFACGVDAQAVAQPGTGAWPYRDQSGH